MGLIHARRDAVGWRGNRNTSPKEESWGHRDLGPKHHTHKHPACLPPRPWSFLSSAAAWGICKRSVGPAFSEEFHPTSRTSDSLLRNYQSFGNESITTSIDCLGTIRVEIWIQAAKMSRVALRRTLLMPALRRPSLMLVLPGRPLPSLFASSTRTVASVADASFWKSLVPKPLRSPTGPKKKTKVQQGWNPATFFIIIFLLIGSMAIQMISLRRDFETFMRQSGVKIDQLREVVEKLQRGEEVDVEEALGTGDAQKELEWEQGRSMVVSPGDIEKSLGTKKRRLADKGRGSSEGD